MQDRHRSMWRVGVEVGFPMAGSMACDRARVISVMSRILGVAQDGRIAVSHQLAPESRYRNSVKSELEGDAIREGSSTDVK